MGQIIQNINTLEKTIEEAALPAVIYLPEKSEELSADGPKLSQENDASSGEKADAIERYFAGLFLLSVEFMEEERGGFPS